VINSIVKKYFKFNDLKKEQKEVIENVLNKKDTIALLPTGFGKSVCFQVPALFFDGLTIVVSPLIALMKDQVEGLKRKEIEAEYINSTLSKMEIDNIYKRILNKEIKILYVSGERLESFNFLGNILKVKVSLIVFDEVHTLLWSEGFRLALGRVYNFINMLDYRVPILALTATATNLTLSKIRNIIKLDNPKIVVANCDRKNIFYKVERNINKIEYIINYVKKNNDIGIIYCLTIKDCNYVHSKLKEANIESIVYYGTLDSNTKMVNQGLFTSGKVKLIICTNSFGMGIDVSNIRFVINYSIPQSLEDFSQQSGRASRDGKYAEAIILFSFEDIDIINYFIENIDDSNMTFKEKVSVRLDNHKKLDKMIEFCTTKKCLHKYLVNYFNQEHNGKCMMCTNCSKKRIIK
jgi:ATP-dependent DNA helicase RecQ